jgi:hypothetical protein
MISVEELKNLCTDRLEDARTLFNAERYEGAFYICGYVVELGLKMRICRTLGWQGYPKSKKEFDSFSSFKTHNLEILLHLSGLEFQIKEEFFPQWSVVISWDPEIRYSSEKRTAEAVQLMLTSSETLLKIL